MEYTADSACFFLFVLFLTYHIVGVERHAFSFLGSCQCVCQFRGRAVEAISVRLQREVLSDERGGGPRQAVHHFCRAHTYTGNILMYIIILVFLALSPGSKNQQSESRVTESFVSIDSS